jgi:sugar/nucleoside kinase (ribokinase family)
MQRDGMRVLQPLPDAPSWFGCFDAIQLNEDEMHQLSPDPMGLSAAALGAGVSLLLVTLGARGTAYVAAPGFDGWGAGHAAAPGMPIRTALVSAPSVETLDPTGCGDVFGSACCARLLAGVPVPDAIRDANALAARNAAFRGAGGLVRHLRGELVAP